MAPSLNFALTANGDQFYAVLGQAETRMEKFALAADQAGETALGRLSRGQEMLRSLDDELKLLQAGNDQARQRVRLAQELRDTLEAIANSQLDADTKAAAALKARAINAEKLAEVESRSKGKFAGAIDAVQQGVAQLGGTGAIIKMVAQTTAMAADSMGQFARSAMDGKKGGAELFQSFLDGLPIIGDATKATQKVESALTDCVAATLQWSGYSETVVDQWRSADSTAAKVAQMSERTAAAWARMQQGNDLAKSYDRELELLNAANDAERERIGLRHELEDELKKIDAMGANERRFEFQDKAREINAKKLADLEARLAQEAADEQAKLDDEKRKANEEAAKAVGKRLEAEAKHWLGKWDQINKQVAEAKKEGEKWDAEQAKLKQDAADKMYDATRQPLEKYANKLAEVSMLLDEGKIDAETALRAAEGAKKEAGFTADAKPVLPELIERGSAAAFKNAARDVSGKKIDEQQLKALEDISKTLKESLAKAGATTPFEVMGPEALSK